MSKAIAGVALLAGAAVAGAFTLGLGGVALEAAFNSASWIGSAIEAAAATGVSMEAGAIAAALTSNRGTNITTRQPAAFRQIIYGEQRVGGIIVYQSTTGSHHDQYNYVIVFAGHEIDSFVNLYLDGRQVVFTGSGVGNTTRNGVNFGGNADGGNHTGPNGVQYNFGGLVYAEACFGDQTNVANTTPGGGYNTGLHANDPVWAPTAQGLPYLGGCAYLYVKIEYNPEMFPNAPEIKATIRGKNDIYDPRTGTVGYTNNWALIAADVFADPQFGLGDASVNMTQLAAAANVCDEAVALAAGGTEPRYACNTHYDSSTGPGAAISSIMPAAAGRFTRSGGQWYLWPAYWQGPSFSFNEGSLAAEFTWKAYRDRRDLFNRATGTYTAPNYPYNATAADGSNLYDNNGFYEGEIQDNFGFAWQPTSIPYYAKDALHGYPADEYRLADAGNPIAWDAGTTYLAGSNVTAGAVIYTSLRDGNVGNTPGVVLAAGSPAYWSATGGLLTRDFDLRTVCSISQAQRVLKINLERNRQQGSSTLMMFPAAFQMQQLDVFTFNFASLGFANKMLEVTSVALGLAPGKNGVPTPQVKVGVQETAASVYEWSTAEELDIYVTEVAPQQSYIPIAPTNLVLTSSAATAVKGADGVVQPRVLVSWDEPLDGLVQQIELNVQGPVLTGVTPPDWSHAGLVSVQIVAAYVAGLGRWPGL